MSESLDETEKENFRKFFAALLGPYVDLSVMNRALSSFLSDNFNFSDFNLRFDPPLILNNQMFKALIEDLSDDFDYFGISGAAGRIFMSMVRVTPENKKRVIMVFLVKNVNGETIYLIENINGKTYINS